MNKRLIEFMRLAKPILRDKKFLELKKYTQHGKTSIYKHVFTVSYACFRFAKRYHLPVDYQVLVRSTLLHDLFFYDWHDKNKGFRWHGFKHARIACLNAIQLFNISKKEQRIISSHMWPLNLFKIPTSIEGWILCYIDKRVSLIEVFVNRTTKV